MYQAYWNLREPAFGGSHEPRYFYTGQPQQEALARIDFLATQGRNLGLLVGAGGTGKSYLMQYAMHLLTRRGRQAVSMNLLGLDQLEFVSGIARQLGYYPEPTATLASIWQKVREQLTVNRYQQVQTVFLLDDGHEAAPDVLTAIARLAQWQPESDLRSSIVISSDVDQIARVGMRLLELSELRIDVGSWDMSDTAAYLKHSLAVAGRREPVFDVAAIEHLHEISEGVPRRIRKLAELSLIAAAGEGRVTVDTRTIEAVDEELSVCRC